MTSERRRRVEELYLEVLARPPHERAEALAAACPGDPALAADVQSLLDQPDSAAGFLAAPALEMAARLVSRVGSSFTGHRLGAFEVQALLGVGGMGEVYRARDTRLGRTVAIKILPRAFRDDPGRLARFEREARLLASLSHPHICALHDVGREGDTSYIVMELVEGEALSDRLRRGPPPLATALDLARQIAEALEAAHEKGILHRDLKPGNVRVTSKGSVKLLDFGLARAMQDGPARCGPARFAENLSNLSTLDSPASPSTGVSGTAPYMSPEQVRGEELDRRADIWAFGCVLFEMLCGKPAFSGGSAAEAMTAVVEQSPPWSMLPDTVPAAIRRLLERCLQKDRTKRLRDVADARLEVEELLSRGPGGGRLPVEDRSPYPGLRSFTEGDAARFFGREGEVSALWSKITARRLLAVIGPSGAGKTSFVRAGIVASRPRGWAGLVCTPGTRPFAALAQGLAPTAAGDAEAVSDLLRIEEAERALAAVSRWRRGHVEALLVVDQFEELFTLNPPEVQARFAALLGRIAADGDIHVLLSMRDDFLIRCHEQPVLAPVFEHLTPLLPLDGQALRRALLEPAACEGYAFEDETLVDELLAFVARERGALPLLAFAVARLWEKRDTSRKLLTHKACREIGGVSGALAQHAEATLESIGAQHEECVREAFRNLVTAQGTRAVLEREELLSALPAGPGGEEVLRKLIDARLLTSYEVEGTQGQQSRHRIELIHESLLAAWPRLVRWQTQDADGAQLRDQLRQAAHLWDEKGRTPDLLWTGTAEREFELWRERYPGHLTAIEDDFARAMVGREQRRRHLRRMAFGSVMAAAVAVAAVTRGLWLRSEVAQERAVAEAQRAEASKLLALAQLRLEADPTEALALTTASLELADTREARVFAIKSLWEAPPALELPGVGDSARSPAFSPDGRWLAAAGHSEDVIVWDETGERVARLAGHPASPNGGNLVEWGPEGVLVAGSFAANRLQIWSLPRGERLRTIELGGGSFWRVYNGLLLTETEDPPWTPDRQNLHLRSWPLRDGESEDLGRVDWRTLGASKSEFAPNGKGWLYARGAAVYLRPLPSLSGARDRLLTRHAADVDGFGPRPLYARDATGEIRLFTFPVSGPPHVEVVPKPETAATRIFPEPGGRWLVGSAGQESRARLWSRTAWPGARPLVLRRNASWYGAVTAFHPTGDWLVASTAGYARLTFWPLNRTLPAVLDGYKRLYRILAFSPDGRWLVTTWSDGQLRLWPLQGMAEGPKNLNLPEPGHWSDAAFEPHGRFIFVVGIRGLAYIVPLDGAPPRRLDGFTSEMVIRSAAVSPSGRQVAAAFNYGQGRPTLRVWDVESGAARSYDLPEGQPGPATAGAEGPVRTGYEGGVFTVRFASETSLFTSGDGGIRRWDLDSGTNTQLLAAGSGRHARMFVDGQGRVALVKEWSAHDHARCQSMQVVDLMAGTTRPLPAFGDCVVRGALAPGPAGLVAAVGDNDGIVRVGRLDGGEPHLLVGHEGAVDFVAISPDLKWVASSGEDNTLRLWPMPDLDQPPLHTLPHNGLIAKLKSLTNFRAVADPAAPNGWKIEIGPFPGWKDVPTW